MNRGDIYLAELDPTKRSEIKKTRPVIIVTNNLANTYSQLVTVIPLTSQKLERVLKFELFIDKSKGLSKSSKALVQQIRTIDKIRLKKKLSYLSEQQIFELDIKIKLHLGLE